MTRPITAPSTVFLGEVSGAIGRLPYIRPPKYDAESNTQTPTSTLTIAAAPFGRSRMITRIANGTPR